jgi:hypothetical protein
LSPKPTKNCYIVFALKALNTFDIRKLYFAIFPFHNHK